MPSAEEAIESELEEIERKLEGFFELVQRRDRLVNARAALRGSEDKTPSRRSKSTTAPFDEDQIIHAAHVLGGPASATELREQLGRMPSRKN